MNGKRRSAAGFRVIDCDIHPHVRSLDDLAKYMTEAYRRRIGLGAGKTWASSVPAAQFEIPKTRYTNTAGVMRRDAAPPEGGVPNSDPKHTASVLLDAYNIEYGILIGGNVLGLAAFHDADLATAFAQAYNDWLDDVWLSADPRYRASITVAPQDPFAAAKEIDRLGQHPGFVQVFIGNNHIPLGKRHYWPIYEAAQRHGLPIVQHPGAESAGRYEPAEAVGPASSYFEWHTKLALVPQAQLCSLICEGIFERFPELKVVLCEGGYGWLPTMMYRLDKNWKALRDETPWVKRPPSEYILEHIRLTTQPFEEPEAPRFAQYVFEMIHADRTLMFSTDYPHWDFDNPFWAIPKVDERYKSRVLYENAWELYGHRLRLGPQPATATGATSASPVPTGDE